MFLYKRFTHHAFYSKTRDLSQVCLDMFQANSIALPKKPV